MRCAGWADTVLLPRCCETVYSGWARRRPSNWPRNLLMSGSPCWETLTRPDYLNYTLRCVGTTWHPNCPPYPWTALYSTLPHPLTPRPLPDHTPLPCLPRWTTIHQGRARLLLIRVVRVTKPRPHLSQNTTANTRVTASARPVPAQVVKDRLVPLTRTSVRLPLS
uniref:Uncharacterized protein n=1 Tax=Cacopsylla melanoneura TaxID=428564 RepID=A0A8D8WNI7_9HEMI